MREFVELGNARKKEQIQVMQQIVVDGVCPFCMDNLARYHKKPILKDGKYWVLTENQWPYENTKHHWLAIYKEHVENVADVPAEGLKELMGLFQEIIKDYTVEGGGIVMRFGTPELSGGTVLHLHAQMVVPDLNSPTYEPVRIKVGRSKK